VWRCGRMFTSVIISVESMSQVSILFYSVLIRTSVVLVILCRSIVVDLCCPDRIESSVDSGINTVPIPTALANRAQNLLKQITYMRHDLTGSLHKGSGW